MNQFIKGSHVLYNDKDAIVLDSGTFYEMECKFCGGPMFLIEDETTYSKTTGSLPTVVLFIDDQIEFCTKPSDLIIVENSK